MVSRPRECEALFALGAGNARTILARELCNSMRLTSAEGHELILHDAVENQASTNTIVQFGIVRGEPGKPAKRNNLCSDPFGDRSEDACDSIATIRRENSVPTQSAGNWGFRFALNRDVEKGVRQERPSVWRGVTRTG
jgi:hypothetical protein